jgi:hypothetical protein
MLKYLDYNKCLSTYASANKVTENSRYTEDELDATVD